MVFLKLTSMAGIELAGASIIINRISHELDCNMESQLKMIKLNICT
jgi:hypothetical protein